MKKKHLVYRYIDNEDGIIKYVGLTSRKLSLRVKEHEKLDAWVKTSKGWHIDYFHVDTKSQSEAWESHLIALYHTDKWYNKAKNDWGLIQEFIPITPCWSLYSDNGDIFDFPKEKLPIISDTKGLISDIELSLNYHTPLMEIHRLISKKKIQPLAKDSHNHLFFIASDEENVYNYLYH